MKWFDIPDELLPPVYRRIKDMYAYARSLDTELRDFLVYANQILNNFFIQTCDLETIEYWERLLGIILSGGETIDERRQNILLYLNNSSPTTEPYVRKVLSDTFGEDNYSMSFDVAGGKPFDLNIEIYLSTPEKIKRFMRWMYKMCPAHIQLNAIQIDEVESALFIYCHAESDVSSTATLPLTPGTATVYYGETASTVETLEV